MASGFTTLTNEHLIRGNIYSRQIRELLLDSLCAQRFVRILTEFPDGTTFNIPSLGEAETFDFAEGQAIKYSKMDTGNYTFSFDQYKGSAHSISEKFKRDSFWSSDVIAAFPVREHRALMEAIETRIFNRANAGQTASDPNTINTAAHRWVGSGTSETLAPKDFALALHALQKANVPLNNLVAIVDPSAAYALATQTNLMNMLSPVPQWQNLIDTNYMPGGMSFKFNVFGFDVYISNYLPTGIAETIVGPGGSRTTTTAAANLFFSATPGDTMPIIGGFRQMPTVYTEFNKDLQQTEYLTISEYGFKLYRPENMVIILTDTDQVA